jgi:RNA polymerase sigma-70 factor (ECF subfamily)
MSEAGTSSGLDEARLRSVYARVRRTVFRLLGYREDLEDIVQAAMEGFVKSHGSFRGEGSLEGFADAIAANVARTWMRRQRRTVLLREIVAERDAWPDLGEGPEEETQTLDRLRRLTEILEKIKVEYRMACLLYYVENKTVAEIARTEGTSENAIRLRILRGRRAIRRHAGKDPVLAEWLGEIGESR